MNSKYSRDFSKPNPECNICKGVGCPICWLYSFQVGKEAVTRPNMVNLIIELYSALAHRNDCPNCGGRGIQYIEVGGEADAEPCDCVVDAWQVLNDCQKSFKMVVDEYLWLEGIDEAEILRDWQTIEAGLLERLKERM